ncbi:MAG: hypothetical protein ACJ8AG_11355 [Ktedonobacteraceae bacterium]
MPEPRTCHLPNITALFCIGVDHLGRTKGVQHHGTYIAVSDMTEVGNRR